MRDKDSQLDKSKSTDEEIVGNKPDSRSGEFVIKINKSTASRVFVLMSLLGAAGVGYIAGKSAVEKDVVACNSELKDALSKTMKTYAAPAPATKAPVITSNGTEVPMKPEVRPAEAESTGRAHEGPKLKGLDPAKAGKPGGEYEKGVGDDDKSAEEEDKALAEAIVNAKNASEKAKVEVEVEVEAEPVAKKRPKIRIFDK